jgi:hypothetical protein
VPYEGTWINLLGAIGGLAVLLVVRGIGGRSPELPPPFAQVAAFIVVVALAGFALAISVRGLSPFFAITGLFAIAYLLVSAAVRRKSGSASSSLASLWASLAVRWRSTMRARSDSRSIARA